MLDHPTKYNIAIIIFIYVKCKLSFSLHKYSAKFHLHKVNITNYGMAVMLSVNISAYKGGVPRKHVLVRSSVFLMI